MKHIFASSENRISAVFEDEVLRRNAAYFMFTEMLYFFLIYL